jgi:hypothetical protein
MPTFHKVSAAQAATWNARHQPNPRDDRYDWTKKPALLYITLAPRPLSQPPRLGDVVRLRGTLRILGIVIDVRTRRDGIWTHVELAYNGTAKWVSKSTIAEHLGHTKGISRIDQPTKLINDRLHSWTHSWFVRVYDGKLPKIAKTFSDRAAGGRLAALKAALAFHAAHVEADPHEAIPF